MNFMVEEILINKMKSAGFELATTYNESKTNPKFWRFENKLMEVMIGLDGRAYSRVKNTDGWNVVGGEVNETRFLALNPFYRNPQFDYHG